MKTLISLGSDCRTRYQIDQFLKKIGQHDAIGSYFFDTLSGGNIEGVLNFVGRDFSLQREDIYIVEHKGRFVPGDKRSNFHFFHDFGTRHQFWETYADCESAMKTAFAESMQKYFYLGEKTLKALTQDNNICLLYYGDCDCERFAELQKLLHCKFNKDFMVVNVLNRGAGQFVKTCDVPTILVDDDNNPKRGTEQEWQGWEESWASALAKIY